MVVMSRDEDVLAILAEGLFYFNIYRCNHKDPRLPKDYRPYKFD